MSPMGLIVISVALTSACFCSSPVTDARRSHRPSELSDQSLRTGQDEIKSRHTKRMVKQITRLASPLDRSGSDTLQRLAAGVATSLNQDARLQTVEEHNFVRNTKTSAIPHQPALTDGGSNWPLSPWEAPEKYPRGELYRSMKDSWTTSNEIQRSMGDHLDLKTTSTTSTRLDSMIQYLHLEALIQKANYPIPKSYNIVKCSSEIPDSKAWSQFSKKAWKTQPEFQERVRKVEMELTKRIDDLHQVLNSDQKESYVYYRDWIRQAIVRYEGSATTLSTEEKTAINDSQLAFRNKNPLEFHFGMAYACVAAGIEPEKRDVDFSRFMTDRDIEPMPISRFMFGDERSIPVVRAREQPWGLRDPQIRWKNRKEEA